jgi:hypothetical protein
MAHICLVCSLTLSVHPLALLVLFCLSCVSVFAISYGADKACPSWHSNRWSSLPGVTWRLHHILQSAAAAVLHTSSHVQPFAGA